MTKRGPVGGHVHHRETRHTNCGHRREERVSQRSYFPRSRGDRQHQQKRSDGDQEQENENRRGRSATTQECLGTKD